MAKKSAKKTTKKKRRTRRQAHPQGLKDPLVFVDTNILLDFYRAPNDQSLALLARLDGIKDRTITSYQVEMEFKKNRQKVILDGLRGVTAPSSIELPAFLRGSQAAETARKKLADLQARMEGFRNRIDEALNSPTQRDPVYQTAQRLFSAKTPFNLNRCNTEIYKRRHVLRRDAFKRFVLGYPPRKQSDTSIGDAVNWEWIIACATPDRRDVVIVSRDSDYGVPTKKEPTINDWLLTEFRSRVSKQGQVRLTPRLSSALKWIDEPVTIEEIEGEERLIEQTTQAADRKLWTRNLLTTPSGQPIDSLLKAFLEQLAGLTKGAPGLQIPDQPNDPTPPDHAPPNEPHE